MKVADLIETKLYKFYTVDKDGFKAFVTNSANLEQSISTMKRHAERTGKKIEVTLDGKKVGEITKSGYKALTESVIKSAEGSIDSDKLNQMIDSVIKKHNIKVSRDKIKKVVIMDYEDSDISKVNPKDIVEIIDASF